MAAVWSKVCLLRLTALALPWLHALHALRTDLSRTRGCGCADRAQDKLLLAFEPRCRVLSAGGQGSWPALGGQLACS